jgi:hypothetical protein
MVALRSAWLLSLDMQSKHCTNVIELVTKLFIMFLFKETARLQLLQMNVDNNELSSLSGVKRLLDGLLSKAEDSFGLDIVTCC